MVVSMIGRVELAETGRRVIQLEHLNGGGGDARGWDGHADGAQRFRVLLEVDDGDFGNAGRHVINGDTGLVVFPTESALGHVRAAERNPRFLDLPEGVVDIVFMTETVIRTNGNAELAGARFSVKRLRWAARVDDDYVQGSADVYDAEDEEEAEVHAQERTEFFLGLMREHDISIDDHVIVFIRENGAIRVTVNRHRFERMPEVLRAVVRRYRCAFIYDKLAYVLQQQRNGAPICRTGHDAVEVLSQVARSLFCGVALHMSAAQFERMRRILLRADAETGRVWSEPRNRVNEPLRLARDVIADEDELARDVTEPQSEDEIEDEMDQAGRRDVQIATEGIFHSTSIALTVRRNGVALSTTLGEVQDGDEVRVSEDTWAPVMGILSREAMGAIVEIRPRLLGRTGEHYYEQSRRLGGLSIEVPRCDIAMPIANPPYFTGAEVAAGEVGGRTRAGRVMTRFSEVIPGDAAGLYRRVQTTHHYNVDGEIQTPEDAVARANDVIQDVRDAGNNNTVIAEPQPPGNAVTLVNEAGVVVHRIPYGRAAFTINGAPLHTNMEQLNGEIHVQRRFRHVAVALRTVGEFSATIESRAERFNAYGQVHRAGGLNGDENVRAAGALALMAWGDVVFSPTLEPGIATISSLPNNLPENQGMIHQRLQGFLQRVPAHLAEVLFWAAGLWLGDGTRNTLSFAIGDAEAAQILPQLARVGTLRPVGRRNADAVQMWTVRGRTPLRYLLETIGVMVDKFISPEAIDAVRRLHPQLRKSFIAGLVDSDGCVQTVRETDLLVFSQSLNRETPAWSHETILIAMGVISQSLGLEVHYGERWAARAAPIYDRERRVHMYHLGQAERRAVHGNARVRVGICQIRGALGDLPIQVQHKRIMDRWYLEQRDMTSSSGLFVAERRAPRAGERVTCIVVGNSAGFFDDNGYWCQTVGEVPWNDPTDPNAPYPFGWLRRDAVTSEVFRAILRGLPADFDED